MNNLLIGIGSAAAGVVAGVVGTKLYGRYQDARLAEDLELVPLHTVQRAMLRADALRKRVERNIERASSMDEIDEEFAAEALETLTEWIEAIDEANNLRGRCTTALREWPGMGGAHLPTLSAAQQLFPPPQEAKKSNRRRSSAKTDVPDAPMASATTDAPDAPLASADEVQAPHEGIDVDHSAQMHEALAVFVAATQQMQVADSEAATTGPEPTPAPVPRLRSADKPRSSMTTAPATPVIPNYQGPVPVTAAAVQRAATLAR